MEEIRIILEDFYFDLAEQYNVRYMPKELHIVNSDKLKDGEFNFSKDLLTINTFKKSSRQILETFLHEFRHIFQIQEVPLLFHHYNDLFQMYEDDELDVMIANYPLEYDARFFGENAPLIHFQNYSTPFLTDGEALARTFLANKDLLAYKNGIVACAEKLDRTLSKLRCQTPHDCNSKLMEKYYSVWFDIDKSIHS